MVGSAEEYIVGHRVYRRLIANLFKPQRSFGQALLRRVEEIVTLEGNERLVPKYVM